MARTRNYVELVGNVGRDPELRSTAAGKHVANFSLATSKRVRDGRGGYKDQTEWHRLVAWDRIAELVNDYVKKGSRLLVIGHLHYGQFEKDGVNVQTTDIIIDEIFFLDTHANDASRKSPFDEGDEEEERSPFSDDDEE